MLLLGIRKFIKDDAACIVDDRFCDAEEIQTTLTTGIGLRDRKASKKDLIVDPANRKERGNLVWIYINR